MYGGDGEAEFLGFAAVAGLLAVLAGGDALDGGVQDDDVAAEELLGGLAREPVRQHDLTPGQRHGRRLGVALGG
ncbi:hypothetical protein GL263_02875, partial [Streptomyces durbertensis]|nr:hypothetical protein [Streptomyces durbertensis]